MSKSRIGLNNEYPFCIRDGNVYCSTLVKYNKWDRSPKDEDVKAFKTKDAGLEHLKKHFYGYGCEVIIPYKEWENQDE